MVGISAAPAAGTRTMPRCIRAVGCERKASISSCISEPRGAIVCYSYTRPISITDPRQYVFPWRIDNIYRTWETGVSLT